MTRVARSRQSSELAGRRIFMAVITLQQSVGADEGKAVLVILNLLERNLPSLNGVATLTIRAELAAMNVGVAIGAV